VAPIGSVGPYRVERGADVNRCHQTRHGH
jgi:hypothetical protein